MLGTSQNSPNPEEFKAELKSDPKSDFRGLPQSESKVTRKVTFWPENNKKKSLSELAGSGPIPKNQI